MRGRGAGVQRLLMHWSVCIDSGVKSFTALSADVGVNPSTSPRDRDIPRTPPGVHRLLHGPNVTIDIGVMSGIACAEPETWELSDNSVGRARALEPNPRTTGTTLAVGSSSSGAMQSPGDSTSTHIGEWLPLAQVAA